MDKYELIDELKKVISEYLTAQSLELVELVHHYEGRDLILRVLADRPEGGISLGECARLNAGIGALLDEKGLLEQHYILEVSSPGLDRPLTTKNDFCRCPGKLVHVFLKEPWRQKWEYEGIINKVTPEVLCLETRGNIIELPLTVISRAKQVI
ncbi:MAG: ribosome maturation factor RimP [Candidatus Omnitrophota bacterium]|nr:ribosome maturation factor RimP [Candidatus Omnitrophota bacterium]